MAMMTAYVQATINGVDCEIELTGTNCKLWMGYGLPVYEGDIEGLKEYDPDTFQYLLDKGYIKAV